MIKINSISDIVDRYDNFIIDQWGVMHDGTSGYTNLPRSSDNKDLSLILGDN